jgi:cytochrome c oxidase assembly protein subunit 15
MYKSQAPCTTAYRKQIAVWLLICCVTIFAMVVLGGVTRLTGSGLSMVEWKPIMGILPPLNHAEWEDAFRLYQQTPEFNIKNFHMGVEEFKGIFWLEYAHRLLGRAIGFIFFIPMLFFMVTGRVSKDLVPKLIIMFVLGGLEGLLGWYMVQSGLVDAPHVSHYRLTAHLGFAVIIYAYIFWVALELLFPKDYPATRHGSYPRAGFSYAITTLVFITTLSGGLVAGLKAGLIYNTFPLMGAYVLPPGMLEEEPVWLNVFENMVTVQFQHRLLAIIVCFVIVVYWVMARRNLPAGRGRLGVNLLLMAVVLQLILGISTLVLHVPVSLAAAHQGGALLLFSAALFVSHALRRT